MSRLRGVDLAIAAITAQAIRTFGALAKLAGGCIAAGVGAALRQAAVTVLALIDKAIAAARSKEDFGLVKEAVVNAVLKGALNLLHRTG